MLRPVSFPIWLILFCLAPADAAPIFFGAVSSPASSDQFFFYEKDDLGTEISVVTHLQKDNFGEVKNYAGTIAGNFQPVAIFSFVSADDKASRLGLIAHDENKMPYLFMVLWTNQKTSQIDFSGASSKLIEGLHPSSDSVILGATQFPNQPNQVALIMTRNSAPAQALEIKNVKISVFGDVSFDTPIRPGPRIDDAVPLVLFGDAHGGLRALIAAPQSPEQMELGRFELRQRHFVYRAENQISFPQNTELATGLRKRHRKVCAALIAS